LLLATRGAQRYEQQQNIAVRRAERWAAVVPAAGSAELPASEETRHAILVARGTAS